MSFVIGVLIAVVQAYFFVLLARVVLDIVEMTAQDWRPSGVGLLATNAVYRLTDPPLRFLGRFHPAAQGSGRSRSTWDSSSSSWP